MHLRRCKKMQWQASAFCLRLFGCLTLVSTLFAQEPCRVVSPTATFSIPYAKTEDRLDTDPTSSFWLKASSAWILKDCSRELDYPELRTEVRGLWTDTHLYFLFACPYRKLNVFLPTQNDRPRTKLWDRDVVEMFLGDDWKNIRHYREFEIARPATGSILPLIWTARVSTSAGDLAGRCGRRSTSRRTAGLRQRESLSNQSVMHRFRQAPAGV